MARRDRELERWIGRVLEGRYRLDALIGWGGMGAVFAATDQRTQREVAVKIVDQLARSETAFARFSREAKAVGAIDSRYVVRIFDAATSELGPFLVMERLRGVSLSTHLKAKGPLPVRAAVELGVAILKGLEHAHARGIVHRDLKPSNVFLAEEDGEVAVKIVDFGIAKVMAVEGATSPLALTGTDVMLGTPGYMAPEQAQAASSATERTDVYGAGAVLYAALSGRPPHAGSRYHEVIAAVCLRDVPPLGDHAPEVPPPLAGAIMRALRREPGLRFATAAEMREALSAAFDVRARPRDDEGASTRRPGRLELAHLTAATLASPIEPRPIEDSPAVAPDATRVSGAEPAIPFLNASRWRAIAAVAALGLGLVVAWFVARSREGPSDLRPVGARASGSAEGTAPITRAESSASVEPRTPAAASHRGSSPPPQTVASARSSAQASATHATTRPHPATTPPTTRPKSTSTSLGIGRTYE